MSNNTLRRRRFLQFAAATVALPTTDVFAEEQRASRLGLVTYCCRIRCDHMKRADPTFDLFAPENMLEHCRALGAGGMQSQLGTLDAAAAGKLRQAAEKAGLFFEAIVSAPFKNDVERFESEMKTAAAVGAAAVRTTIIPGRRYEFFDNLEKFREYERRGREALQRAAPIVEKYKVPLAVENHKDHRNDERVALFEHIGSEYVGACVDTGNSLALCEDPIETVRSLAPWAHSVHLKDQAVQPYADGFLLADIPLGQGSLDLKKMVDILRREKPRVNFSLELITRDPLKVPTFSEKYWSTFPDLSARELARTIRLVRDRATDNLQYVSRMTPTQQLALEDANVRASLAYAAKSLGL